MVTIALSKDGIYEERSPCSRRRASCRPRIPRSPAKLILPTGTPGVRVIIVRASDVPPTSSTGRRTLGVAGRDLLIEHGGAALYQPLDLGIARCRMMVAVPEDFDYPAAVRKGARLRVATKYIQIAREHFAAKGVHVDLIKLYGLDGARALRSGSPTPRGPGPAREHPARNRLKAVEVDPRGLGAGSS